eukprot:tig00001030_g6475.t1
METASNLLVLPAELILCICRVGLNARDLCAVRSTCKALRKIVPDSQPSFCSWPIRDRTPSVPLSGFTSVRWGSKLYVASEHYGSIVYDTLDLETHAWVKMRGPGSGYYAPYIAAMDVVDGTVHCLLQRQRSAKLTILSYDTQSKEVQTTDFDLFEFRIAPSMSALRGKLWIFGGRVASVGPVNDLHVFDPASRSLDRASLREEEEGAGEAGTAPCGRFGQAQVSFDEGAGRLLVLGGSTVAPPEGPGQPTPEAPTVPAARGASGGPPGRLDVHEYSLAEQRWRRLECSGPAPPPLSGHSASLLHGCVWVLGGHQADVQPVRTEHLRPLDEVHVLRLSDLSWARLRVHVSARVRGVSESRREVLGRTKHCVAPAAGGLLLFAGVAGNLDSGPCYSNDLVLFRVPTALRPDDDIFSPARLQAAARGAVARPPRACPASPSIAP